MVSTVCQADTQQFRILTALEGEDCQYYHYYYIHEGCVELSSLYKSYKNRLGKVQNVKTKNSGCTQTIGVVAGIASLFITWVVAIFIFTVSFVFPQIISSWSQR